MLSAWGTPAGVEVDWPGKFLEEDALHVGCGPPAPWLLRCLATPAQAAVLAKALGGREDNRAAVPLRSWGFRVVGSSPNLVLREAADGGYTRDFVVMAGAAGSRAVATAGDENTRAAAKASDGGSRDVAMANDRSSRVGVVTSIGGGRAEVMVSNENNRVVMTPVDHAHPAGEGRKVPRAPPGAELWWVGRLLDWQRRSQRQA